MSCFAGKVIVITGAGSGIGRSLAQQLAGKGARLALSDIDSTSLQETMSSLDSNAIARNYQLDVSSREAVFKHADDVTRDFGNVHFVINNAGATVVGTIAHLRIEEIEWQLGVNLWGVIYGTKAFLPRFLAQREGCIVNISSVFGLVGFPLQGAYNISKFGVRGLTECLWSELEGTGVRAVCVHPGGIKTNIARAARITETKGMVDTKSTRDFEKAFITTPEKAAEEVVNGILKNKRRVLIGPDAIAIDLMQRILPTSYQRLLEIGAKQRSKKLGGVGVV